MFALKYIRKKLSNHYANMIELVEFGSKAKEELNPEQIRKIHQQLKQYPNNYEMCYNTITWSNGVLTDSYVCTLIITGTDVFRLDPKSDYIMSLQSWARGEHVKDFTSVQDLLKYLFPECDDVNLITQFKKK